MSSLEADTALTVRLVEGFDDPALDRTRWDRALAAGCTDVVFLTWAWQRQWWKAFGGERLMLVLAEQAGEVRAIAPLFALEDMLFFVGSGGSDYLDFIGELDAPTLTAMLDLARQELAQFAGIGLYHVPVDSRTTSLLPEVASQLGLDLYNEEELTAPHLDLADGERVSAALERRKVRKEENRMRRAGKMRFCSPAANEIDEWLEIFFAQHEARWHPEGEEGLEDAAHRTFVRAIVHEGHRRGWVRITMFEWSGAPVAFDISLVHRGWHLSYLVSRDTSIREYSPGKILEREVIRRAMKAGSSYYDFGLGDEAYKLSHASGVRKLANWSLYPP